MPAFDTESDNVRRCVLRPEITRAFWSRRSAWPGTSVLLHVETREVVDGTPVALEIWEDDRDEGSPDDFVERLEGLTIERQCCRIEHTLDWDTDTLGREPGEGDRLEFYFKVLIEDYDLQAKSNLLYVALEPFRISR